MNDIFERLLVYIAFAKLIKKIKPLTIRQLKSWGVKYNKIFFGKPSYDLFIDDKAMFFKKK